MNRRYLLGVSLVLSMPTDFFAAEFLKRALGGEQAGGATAQASYFDSKGHLELHAGPGNVEITGWDKPEIHIEMTKRGADLEKIEAEVEIKDKATKAKIKTKYDDQKVDAAIDYKISVPLFTAISVKTKSGNITIKNVINLTKAETVSGAIVASDLGKGIEAKTESGDINVAFASRCYGKVDAESKSGAVTASNTAGPVKIETKSGSVKLQSRVLSTKDTVDVETKSGNIIFIAPAKAQFTVKAKTKSGAIKGDLPWERSKKDEAKPPVGDEAKAKLGKGYAEIKLESSSGNIEVRQQ